MVYKVGTNTVIFPDGKVPKRYEGKSAAQVLEEEWRAFSDPNISFEPSDYYKRPEDFAWGCSESVAPYRKLAEKPDYAGK